MGYGAGAEIRLNTSGGYVVFNNNGLDVVENETAIESWDFHGEMDGMSNIRTNLLKIKFHPIELNDDDLKVLRDFEQGDRIDFTWFEKPKGAIWYGYIRSPLETVFPTELKGEIDLGFANLIVTITVEPADWDEFKEFVDDVLNFWIDPETLEEGQTIEELYDDHDYNNRLVYGASYT